MPLVIALADLLANDTDPDDDALTVTGFTQPAGGIVVDNNDGTLTYAPNAGVNGPDRFDYTIDDGQGSTDTATVTITVNPVAEPLVAVDDEASTQEDEAVVIDVLANDVNASGNALVVTAVTQGANGTVGIRADFRVLYEPAANFNGTDTFTYLADDGNGGTDTATVTITVTSVGNPPVAVDDTATTDEDTPITIAVLVNDSDPNGDPIAIGLIGTPANGFASINLDGTVTYAPNPGFGGSDSFDYSIHDSQDNFDSATVFVIVNPVNDLPVAVDDSAVIPVNVTLTIDVIANDSDADGEPLTVVAVGPAANGAVTNDGNGFVTYIPNPDFLGTDSFTYTIADPQGAQATATVTVQVDGDDGGATDPGA